MSNLSPDWSARGRAAADRQDLELVADAYERMADEDPSSSEAQDNLGGVLTQLGQYLPALQCHLRAIQLDPDNALAHLNLATLIQEYGDLLIESALETALQLDPEMLEAEVSLGKLSYDRGDFPRALAFFKKAAQHNVNDLDAYNHMGLCYASLGDYAKARKYWLKAVSLDVNNYFAHLNLAALYATDYGYERALSHLERILILDPGQAHDDMAAMPQFDELRLDPRCGRLLREHPAPSEPESELSDVADGDPALF